MMMANRWASVKTVVLHIILGVGFDFIKAVRYAEVSDAESALDGKGKELQQYSGALIEEKFNRQQKCSKKFFMYSIEAFEAKFPELKNCMLTMYAQKLQAVGLEAPCRSENEDGADLLVIPGYMAEECNWPHYGPPWCSAADNVWRGGTRCRAMVPAAVMKLLLEHPSKHALLFDRNGYDLEDLKSAYENPRIMWAKLEAFSEYHRPGYDVSMPPPPFPRCTQTPATAWEQPISYKKYKISFKGNLQYHEVRQIVATLSDEKKSILIADDEDSQYDFDQLLQGSTFNLVLRGQNEFSYRLSEAVCSGGVPVLVTENWVPPFNETVPFNFYGVVINQNDAKKIPELLSSIPEVEVEQRRHLARSVCKSIYDTVDKQLMEGFRVALENVP